MKKITIKKINEINRRIKDCYKDMSKIKAERLFEYNVMRVMLRLLRNQEEITMILTKK